MLIEIRTQCQRIAALEDRDSGEQAGLVHVTCYPRALVAEKLQLGERGQYGSDDVDDSVIFSSVRLEPMGTKHSKTEGGRRKLHQLIPIPSMLVKACIWVPMPASVLILFEVW
jgi:hypothetical protein